MAFTQKLLAFQISQASGGSMNISGLRASVVIEGAAGPTMISAEGAIWGLTLSQMNQLTTLGKQTYLIGQNSITIQAGDDASSLTTVFIGTIMTAFMDAASMPQVAFRFVALSGGYQSVMKSKPTSVKGTGDVAQIAQQLAQKMNLQFDCSGVSVKLSNPYFDGSYRTQMQTLAQHAGISWAIEKDILALWKPGSSRQSGGGNTVAPPPVGNMVGYPAFNSTNVIVTTLWDPSVSSIGQQFSVQSAITAANGAWTTVKYDLLLESIVPRGKWFAIVEGAPIGGTDVSGGQS